MRKIILISMLLLLTLTGCESKEVIIDYSLFLNSVSTYEESEVIEDDFYAMYYYQSTDSNSDDLYESFLTSYNQFDTFKLYVLDTAELADDTSKFGEYTDEPIIYLIKDNNVEETFKGSEGISTFFMKYLELDYSMFEDRMVTDRTQSLIISDSLHFEYYYSENCSHCRIVKPDLLYFFLTNEDLEFYLFDVVALEGSVQIEEFVGTPTLFVIENNVVIKSYIGSVAIPEFIEGYNEGTITFE